MSATQEALTKLVAKIATQYTGNQYRGECDAEIRELAMTLTGENEPIIETVAKLARRLRRRGDHQNF